VTGEWRKQHNRNVCNLYSFCYDNQSREEKTGRTCRAQGGRRILFIKHRGSLEQGCTDFTKIEEPPRNSRHKKGDMKQVPCCGPTNIRRLHTKFRHHDNLAPGIFFISGIEGDVKNGPYRNRLYGCGLVAPTHCWAQRWALVHMVLIIRVPKRQEIWVSS